MGFAFPSRRASLCPAPNWDRNAGRPEVARPVAARPEVGRFHHAEAAHRCARAEADGPAALIPTARDEDYNVRVAAVGADGAWSPWAQIDFSTRGEDVANP